MALNQFSDLTSAEFGAFTNGVVRSQSNLIPVRATRTPREKKGDVDWVKRGAVTPAKNQGSTCGDCWAFSTTGALEGAHFIATNKLVSLSEQELLDCANQTYGNQGCVGGRFFQAAKYVKQHGLCNETSYPYKGVQGTCKVDSIGCKSLVTGPTSVSFGPSHSESELFDVLVKEPVSIVIEADQKCFQFYKEGILTYKECPCGQGGNLDHAVLLVGTGEVLGVGYWTVKNSWGETWGEKGFVRLERNVGSQGEGMCLLTLDASYPNGVGYF